MKFVLVEEACSKQNTVDFVKDMIHERLDAINEERLLLESQLATYRDQEWSEIVTLGHSLKHAKKIGVYALVHIPTSRIGYYGVSGRSLSGRVQTHLYGFNAEGYVDATKDSPAGKKMYQYDPELSNWGVKFLVTKDEGLALQLEKYWGERFPSMFNCSAMLGT